MSKRNRTKEDEEHNFYMMVLKRRHHIKSYLFSVQGNPFSNFSLLKKEFEKFNTITDLVEDLFKNFDENTVHIQNYYKANKTIKPLFIKKKPK